MQKLNKEKSILEKSIGEWTSFNGKLEDAKVLLEMAVEAHDEDSFKEVKSEVAAIQTEIKTIQQYLGAATASINIPNYQRRYE